MDLVLLLNAGVSRWCRVSRIGSFNCRCLQVSWMSVRPIAGVLGFHPLFRLVAAATTRVLGLHFWETSLLSECLEQGAG